MWNSTETVTMIVRLIFCIERYLPMASSSGASEQQQPLITLSDEEWKAQLTPEQYRVLREKATEPAYTGRYDKHFEKGLYKCAGCGNPLYE